MSYAGSTIDSDATDDSAQMMEIDDELVSAAERRKLFDYTGPGDVCPYKHVDTIVEDHGCCIYSVKFCPFVSDTELFATVAGRQVTVYRSNPDRCVPIATYFDDDVNEEYYAVNWAFVKIQNEDEIVLLFGGKNGIIRGIDPIHGTSRSTMIGHGDAVNEIVYHPETPCIFASASKDLTIRIWHVLHGTPIAILGGFKGHQDQILSLDFDWTARYIVSGSMDHTLMLWNVGGNEAIQKRIKELASGAKALPMEPIEMHFTCGQSKDLHKNYVDCVQTMKSYIFSKACENCIVLSKFGEFSDPSAGGTGINGFETFSQQVAELELPNAGLWFIRFGMTTGSPGEAWLACGNDIGHVYIWDLHTIPIPTKSHFTITHRDFPTVIRRVEFSPAGTTMIVVGDGGRVSRCDKMPTSPDIWGISIEFSDEPGSSSEDECIRV